ncbi:hypothetical protein B1C81_33755 [Streptomyces sp. HG99]|nr:hypothetical protein B1C81_33755 [Streptomyces sp. HG99]
MFDAVIREAREEIGVIVDRNALRVVRGVIHPGWDKRLLGCSWPTTSASPSCSSAPPPRRTGVSIRRGPVRPPGRTRPSDPRVP